MVEEPVPMEETEDPEEEDIEIEILYCSRCGWIWEPGCF